MEYETTEAEDIERKAQEYSRWLDAIQKAGKGKVKEWEDRGDKIVARYRDERKANDARKKYNILWSNVSTLKPAVFGNTPVPNVSRRFNQKDETGKQASIILERALSVHWDDGGQSQEIDDAVDDYLLTGRGTVRVKYKPSYGDVIGQDDQGNPVNEVAFEEALLEYVFWKDFRHGKARRWKDVPWVAFRTYPDKKELKKKWPDIYTKIPCEYRSEEEGEKTTVKKALVWEIWDKKSGEVKFLAEGYTEGLLESVPAPLNFQNFYPCPKPLYATTTTNTLIPVPDFTQYQDQADELDDLSERINLLLDALAVRGVYDASHSGLESLLSNTSENALIPVENWAMYAERGGLQGAISYLPIDQIISVLVKLYEARERTKQELYEITGLSDILRGASNPNETATAQKLKGQFGSLRLDERQKDVARFVKECICLQAEVISEHFEPTTLQLMTGEEVTQDILQLLRTDPIRTFRIDIETDSTIKVDQVQERKDRLEFLKTATDYLSAAVQIGASSPALNPLLGEMLMFGVRGFKIGRELEEVIEQTLEQLNQPQEPDPMEERVKALELALKQAEVRDKNAEAEETEQKAIGQEIENTAQVLSHAVVSL